MSLDKRVKPQLSQAFTKIILFDSKSKSVVNITYLLSLYDESRDQQHHYPSTWIRAGKSMNFSNNVKLTMIDHFYGENKKEFKRADLTFSDRKGIRLWTPIASLYRHELLNLDGHGSSCLLS